MDDIPAYCDLLDRTGSALNDEPAGLNTPLKDLRQRIDTIRKDVRKIAQLRIHDRDYDEAFHILEGEFIEMQTTWQFLVGDVALARPNLRVVR